MLRFVKRGLTKMFLAMLGGLAFVGCSSDGALNSGSGGGSHGGGHADTGPHGGSIIEFGTEDYHVEMVHDDAKGEVTFYVLDSTVKNAVPIEAAEVVVNLKVGGAPQPPYKVAAKSDVGDPTGKSSRFFSADPKLAEALDAEGNDAELIVTIDKKPYRGKIAHKH